MAIHAYLGASGLELIGKVRELQDLEDNLNVTKPAESAAKANTVSALYAQILDVVQDFYSVGFPKSAATVYAIAQMMFESTWMTSHVAHVDNNYSGISWINKPYQDATKGLPMPGTGGKGFYAHFRDFRAWAKDFLRVLSLNAGKGRPIDATSSQQYFDRLVANGYFTAVPAFYASGFNAALKKVNAALTWGASQDKKFIEQYKQGQTTFTETAGKGLTSNAEFDVDSRLLTLKHWAENNPLKATAAAAAAALILTKIFK